MLFNKQTEQDAAFALAFGWYFSLLIFFIGTVTIGLFLNYGFILLIKSIKRLITRSCAHKYPTIKTNPKNDTMPNRSPKSADFQQSNKVCFISPISMICCLNIIFSIGNVSWSFSSRSDCSKNSRPVIVMRTDKNSNGIPRWSAFLIPVIKRSFMRASSAKRSSLAEGGLPRDIGAQFSISLARFKD